MPEQTCRKPIRAKYWRWPINWIPWWGFLPSAGRPAVIKTPLACAAAALGCLRIMIECELPLNLEVCIAYSAGTFPEDINAPTAAPDVFDFMLERLRRYYIDNGVSPTVFASVEACRPTKPHDFNLRIQAVRKFLQLPEATSLATADKRIWNILKQANYSSDAGPDEKLFAEKTEIELHRQMQVCGAREHIERGDYNQTSVCSCRPERQC